VLISSYTSQSLCCRQFGEIGQNRVLDVSSSSDYRVLSG